MRSIVIVWIVGAELSSPAVIELRRSAQQALGEQADVRLATEESEQLGAVNGKPSPPVAMARVNWEVRAPEVAHLSCYSPQSRRWVDRDIVFAPNDPEIERGRAIGFVLASIVLEQEAQAADREPPRQAPPVLDSASTPAPPARFAISAGMEAAGPSTGSGFGAHLAAHTAVLGQTWWVGAAGRARFGSLAVAQASTRVLAAGPEVSWSFWSPTPSTWLGLRGGVFLSHIALSHLSDDDIVADEQGRWLPGAELSLHGGIELARSVAVFSEIGVNALAGETELEVRHRVVATWPWASGLLRFGFRSQF